MELTQSKERRIQKAKMKFLRRMPRYIIRRDRKWNPGESTVTNLRVHSGLPREMSK